MNRINWRTCVICGERKKASEMARNWHGVGEHYYADYCKVCKPVHDKEPRYPIYTVVSDANGTYSPGAQFTELEIKEGVPMHAFDGARLKRSGRLFLAYDGKLWGTL